MPIQELEDENPMRTSVWTKGPQWIKYVVLVGSAWVGPGRAEDPLSVPTLPGGVLEGVKVSVVAPERVVRQVPAEYRIVVTSDRDETVRDVIVEAKLSPSLRATLSTPEAEPIEGGLVWKLEELGAKATVELRFSAVAEKPGSVRVEATARTTSSMPTDIADPIAADDPPALPTPVDQGSLTITLSLPERVNVNQPFACEAILSNKGPQAVDNVGFSINLTEGLELSRPPDGADEKLKLEAGQTKRVSLELVAKSAGVQAVRANIEGDGGLSSQTEKDVTAAESAFSVNLEAPKTHVLGTPLRFRIYIANNREQSAADVQAFVPIPETVDVVSAEAGALFNRRTRTVRWRVGTLEPGEERGFRVTLQPRASSELELSASARSVDGTAGEARRTVVVLGHAALGVTVEPSLDMAPVDEPVRVTFDVRSRGSQPARQVRLRLEATPGLKLIDEESTDWTLADGWWEVKAPRDLSAGQSWRATLSLRAVDEGEFMLKAAVVSDDVKGEILRTQPLRAIRSPKLPALPVGN
jgi:hypothetical protein